MSDAWDELRKAVLDDHPFVEDPRGCPMCKANAAVRDLPTSREVLERIKVAVEQGKGLVYSAVEHSVGAEITRIEKELQDGKA